VCVCCVCIHTTKSISWKLKTLGTSEMENLNSGLENKVKETFQKTNKQQKTKKKATSLETSRKGKKGKIHIKDQLLKWILTFLGHIESKKVME